MSDKHLTDTSSKLRNKLVSPHGKAYIMPLASIRNDGLAEILCGIISPTPISLSLTPCPSNSRLTYPNCKGYRGRLQFNAGCYIDRSSKRSR